MWCTRWFIPLLLLPLPAAPPYFLLIYLLTLTLHARPCFYCIILLTALFISSCYWQPIPTNSLLSNPISATTLLSQFLPDMSYSENGTLAPSLLSLNGTIVTTFADAFALPIAALSFPSDLPTLPTSLLAKLPSSFFQTYPELTLTTEFDTPNHELRLVPAPGSPVTQELQKVESPAVMRLLDRCWCDVAGNDGGYRGAERKGKRDRKRRGLWDVFDVSEWELASVARAREEVSREKKSRLRKIEQDWRNAIDVAKQGEEDLVKEDPEVRDEVVVLDTSNETTTSRANSTESEAVITAKRQWRTRGGLFDNLLPFFSRRKPEEEVFILPDAASSPSSSSSPSHDRGNLAGSKSESGPVPEHDFDSSPMESLPPLPLLRREYDLRPYGFAMVIDFGWSSPSRSPA